MKRYQRRNRSGLAKERLIMAAGSALLLGVLTLTGVYVRNLNNQRFENYIVDLTTLEEWDRLPDSNRILPIEDREASGRGVDRHPVVDIPLEIREQIGREPEFFIADRSPVGGTGNTQVREGITSSDLEIGDLILATDQSTNIGGNRDHRISQPEGTVNPARSSPSPSPSPSPSAEPVTPAVPAISTSMQSALTFREGDSLVWPVVGNVLINFSMDKTVYFPTLKHFKYNPAIIIQANEGDIISAAAAGKVTSVFKDTQIGNAIKIDLGNGYEITYGQLKNILVSEGSFVAAGDIVAEVAAPTKYFSVEGTNVYFMLTKDGVAVNPLSKLN